MLRFSILKLKKKQLNNKGMTLTELIVTFAILAIFMLAATRVISYTTIIYHEAKGASYGLEVSNMISQKVVGQIEGACLKYPVDSNLGAGEEGEKIDAASPVVSDGGTKIKFCDATGSIVSIYADTDQLMVVHYDKVAQTYLDETGNSQENVIYKAVDWKFDKKAYMGFRVRELIFENPNTDPANPEYPDNVIRMKMELYSSKYGSYKSTYYIKCPGVKAIRFS